MSRPRCLILALACLTLVGLVAVPPVGAQLNRIALQQIAGFYTVRDSASHTTSGTSEQVIASAAVPIWAFGANNRGIKVTAVFSLAANGNAKVARIRFGPNNTTGDTATVAKSTSTSGGLMALEARIIRTGAGAQAFWGWFNLQGAGYDLQSGTTSQTETTQQYVDIAATTATQAGDITLVWWELQPIF